MAAVSRSLRAHQVPDWQPEPNTSPAAQKRAVAKHRKTVVLPALQQSDLPPNPPLPWGWVVIHAGTSFPAKAFEYWWQLRLLGQTYPATMCPQCEPPMALTREHLQFQCPSFAEHCWTRGIRPEEAFRYPAENAWFTSTLLAVAQVDKALAIRVELQWRTGAEQTGRP